MTMTTVDQQPTGAPEEAAPAVPAVPASWALRAEALAVDIAPGAAVLATTVLVALSVPRRGPWWWVCVGIGAVAILWTAFNRLLLPVISGQSLGRAVFGITVVRRGGGPLGPWWLLLRELAHLLDTAAVLAGWLWPLQDPRRRTFSDLLVGTESRLSETRRPDRNLRRLAAAVMLTAASLCAVAAAITHTVVRQRDQSVAEASAQIAALGPRMVVQMLSYRPETIQSDFDRARSLASNKYREQLSALQQAARKAGPVRNEYWVTNSSVLSATPDRATMLLFLQGERGAPPEQRYIAASVRVTFVESGATGWRVDDVTVVTQPHAAEVQP